MALVEKRIDEKNGQALWQGAAKKWQRVKNEWRIIENLTDREYVDL